ncbi:hypothetical protein ACTXT7_009777 [Hymenolepis weldensis]
MSCQRILRIFGQASYLKPSKCRLIHTSTRRLIGDYEWQDPKSPEEIVYDRDGNVKKVAGKVGDNVMYLAHRYKIDIEGACEASCACSTCHVFVKDEFLNKLPDASDEENDMLDQAPCLKLNSRLACQITLTKELDGMELELPSTTRNFYVDGHKPEPH